MGLHMWMREDIRNVLLGLEASSALQARQNQGGDAQAYREGFQAAVAAIALSFGISPMDVTGEAPVLASIDPGWPAAWLPTPDRPSLP